MLGTGVAPARDESQVRYSDYGAYAWFRSGAPCRWANRAEIEFRYVELRRLQQASSGKHPEIVSSYVRKIRNGNVIAPLVVSETVAGMYYVHDGNHRHEAMRTVLRDPATLVRVAVLVPRSGYCFRWRWFSNYGTYVLEPENLCRFRAVERRVTTSARIRPLLGRTLVFVAHPDDETGGCSALLQRVREPIVVFATSGAPDDEFFWRPYGSREEYGRVRKNEARRALNGIGISAVHFLEDCGLPQARFVDQYLHKSLPQASMTVLGLVEMHRPDAILVPAYEGGHPDHDSCSFIGWVVGRLTSLPVWEMPLYHRSTSGDLVCQRFRAKNHSEIIIRLTESELSNRRALISHYASQTDLGQFIVSTAETYRRQPAYNYSKAPHDGVMNYEAWGWPVGASDLCRSFRQCASMLGIEIEPKALMKEMTMTQSDINTSFEASGI